MAERVELHAESSRQVVAVLGGTGSLGRGLATRWAAAGLDVRIGSRDANRAKDVAQDISAAVSGLANDEALSDCDVAVLAVPWAALEETLSIYRDALADRLVVSCVNPLGFDNHGPFALTVEAGSAAQLVARELPTSTVVAAFHHVSSSLLQDEAAEIDCDVLVLGDDRAAVGTVIGMAQLIPGMRGVYGGRLRNAGQVEALTANLIAINRRYHVESGVRVTGIGG